MKNADFLLPKTGLKGPNPQNGSPFPSDSNPFYKINLGGLHPEKLAKENSNRAYDLQ